MPLLLIIYADYTSMTIASNDAAKLVKDAHQEPSNLVEWKRAKNLAPIREKLSS